MRTLVLGVALLLAGSVSADERFRAIQARTEAALGTEMLRVLVAIREYTTDADARALKDAMVRGGTAAMVETLRRMNHGSITFAEGPREGPPRPVPPESQLIHAAHSYADPEGRRIVIVCGLKSTSLSNTAGAFQIIELVVNGENRGIGRIIEAARVRLDDEGFVDVGMPIVPWKLLTEVRPDI